MYTITQFTGLTNQNFKYVSIQDDGMDASNQGSLKISLLVYKTIEILLSIAPFHQGKKLSDLVIPETMI